MSCQSTGSSCVWSLKGRLAKENGHPHHDFLETLVDFGLEVG